MLISKFEKPILKLYPRSGVTSLLKRHKNVIATTMQILNIKLKKDENLKALNVLARDTGNTKTNYKSQELL